MDGGFLYYDPCGFDSDLLHFLLLASIGSPHFSAAGASSRFTDGEYHGFRQNEKVNALGCGKIDLAMSAR